MPKFKLPRAYRAALAEAGSKGGNRRKVTQTPEQLSEQARKAGLASGAARRAKLAARNAENEPTTQPGE